MRSETNQLDSFQEKRKKMKEKEKKRNLKAVLYFQIKVLQW